jgi:sRNA-binding protein
MKPMFKVFFPTQSFQLKQNLQSSGQHDGHCPHHQSGRQQSGRQQLTDDDLRELVNVISSRFPNFLDDKTQSSSSRLGQQVSDQMSRHQQSLPTELKLMQMLMNGGHRQSMQSRDELSNLSDLSAEEKQIFNKFFPGSIKEDSIQDQLHDELSRASNEEKEIFNNFFRQPADHHHDREEREDEEEEEEVYHVVAPAQPVRQQQVALPTECEKQLKKLKYKNKKNAKRMNKLEETIKKILKRMDYAEEDIDDLYDKHYKLDDERYDRRRSSRSYSRSYSRSHSPKKHEDESKEEKKKDSNALVTSSKPETKSVSVESSFEVGDKCKAKIGGNWIAAIIVQLTDDDDYEDIIVKSMNDDNNYYSVSKEDLSTF